MANSSVDLNSVNLIGRLTKDAEVKKSNDTTIVRFAIAVNRRVNKETKVNYFDLVWFGTGAAAVAQYLTKGKQVAIYDSELSQNSWTAQDGSKHSRIEVIVNKLQLLGGGAQNQNHAADNTANDAANDDENIPF